MDVSAIKAVTDEFADVVRDYLALTIAPLNDRLAGLGRRLDGLPIPRDGIDADPGTVAEIVVGRIASELAEWRGDVERLSAESRVIVAELRAEVITLNAALRDAADQQVARVSEAIRALPVPQDGAPGKDGVDGRNGDPGKDGTAGIDGKDGAPGKDGVDGRNGDPGEMGSEGAAGTDGKDGVPGKDADPQVAAEIAAKLVSDELSGIIRSDVAAIHTGLEEMGEGIDGKVTEQVAAAVAALPAPQDGAPGKDGADGRNGDPGKDGIDGIAGNDGAPGKDGADGRNGDPGERGPEGAAGIDGKDGEPGPPGADGQDGAPGGRGSEGPVGKFVAPKSWAKGIHYESALVTHDGSTYCALRDTADEPPHEDWVLVASRGEDAPVGEVYGLHDETKRYRKFDLVTANGSEWRATCDDPGPLPGDGWVMAARVGKPGRPGEPGPKGDPGIGKPGPSGAVIVRWVKDGYQAAPIMSDGTVGPPLDVREFFELYHGEAG